MNRIKETDIHPLDFWINDIQIGDIINDSEIIVSKRNVDLSDNLTSVQKAIRLSKFKLFTDKSSEFILFADRNVHFEGFRLLNITDTYW